jgi:hypothetical protein
LGRRAQPMLLHRRHALRRGHRRRAGPRCPSAARARCRLDPMARARTGQGRGAVAGAAVEILRRADPGLAAALGVSGCRRGFRCWAETRA